jgi:uncharacterized protein YuzE
MTVHYDPETDSLYIELSPTPGADSREIAPDVVVDLDAAGHVVGLDIQHASRYAELTRLEVHALPLRASVFDQA